MIMHKGFVYIHMRKTGGSWITQALRHIGIAEFLTSTSLGRALAKLRQRFPKLEKHIAEIFIWQLAFHRYKDFKKLPPEVTTEFPKLSKWPLNWMVRGLVWVLRIINERFFAYEPMRLLSFHARYSQILPAAKTMNLLSSMRDPFSWHASTFYYNREIEKISIKSIGESLTNLEWPLRIFRGCESFDAYLAGPLMDYQNALYQIYLEHIDRHGKQEGPSSDRSNAFAYRPGRDKYPRHGSEHYGLLTFNFILMFFERPWEILILPPEEFKRFWLSGRYKETMAKVTLLEQSSLKEEFREYSKQYWATAPAELDKMPSRINVSQNAKKLLEDVYKSRNLVERIHQLEWPIFFLFPQYEEIYKRLLKSASE